MEIIKNIIASTVKARIGGGDNLAVIAETENGKFYCLHYQSGIHGFKKLTDVYKEDIGRTIDSFDHLVFEVEKLVSSKGREYFQALENQY